MKLKYSIIAILLIFQYYEILAQVGRVSYQRILNLDSANNEKDTVGINSVLFFSNQKSYYVYNSIITEKEILDAGKSISTNTYSLRKVDNMGEVFYTDFQSKKINIREFILSNPFTTIEPLATIKWTIFSNEKKIISNISCIKAQATFRGRLYTAWFSLDIPISSGPWKLQGLPGLIIETYDEKKEVIFRFNSIQYPIISKFEFPEKLEGQFVEFSIYKNIWQREIEKMKTFIESTAEKGSTIDINIKYFPIEKSF